MLEPTDSANNNVTLSSYAAGFWRLKDWGLNAQALLAFIEELLAMGVTTMDHAMVYQSEGLFGQALDLNPQLRHSMQIVTKCGIRPVGFGALGAHSTNYYDSSPEAIKASVEASLVNLKTDYIDLLLLHRPDYLMDVSNVAEAFLSLKQAGKVRSFGVSNFSVAQFDVLNQACGGSLTTNQIEFSPYQHSALDSGVFEQCLSVGARPMLWSCLGGGRVTSPQTETDERINKMLDVLIPKYGASGREQLVYAWVKALPCKPVVLLGSSKLDRLRDAVAGHYITLEKEDWYAVLEAARGCRVP